MIVDIFCCGVDVFFFCKEMDFISYGEVIYLIISF